MLNRDVMPRLRVNQLYANLMKLTTRRYQPQSAASSALVNQNMRQRFDTILRVSQAIVEKDNIIFSLTWCCCNAPLVLREIADTLGLHSTISRVTTQNTCSSAWHV